MDVMLAEMRVEAAEDLYRPELRYTNLLIFVKPWTFLVVDIFTRPRKAQPVSRF